MENLTYKSPQAPFPGVVGKHKSNSMVFVCFLVCFFLFCFCLFVLILFILREGQRCPFQTENIKVGELGGGEDLERLGRAE